MTETQKDASTSNVPSLSHDEALNRLAYVYGIARSACEASLPALFDNQDRRQLQLIRGALADLFEPRLVVNEGEKDD
jgi:hypothetical protein